MRRQAHLQTNLRSRPRLSVGRLAGFSVVFGVLGLSLVALILAAGVYSAFEPENGVLSGGAKQVISSGASGGKAIQLSAPTPTPTVTPSPTSTPTPTATPPGGCVSGVTGSAPACATAPPAPVVGGKHWNVSFTEEFNTTDYNHTKLTPCFDWNYGGCTNTFNSGREHYDPAQISVSGGTAKLTAAPLSPPYADNACQNSSCTYKAGLLSTARPRADNGSDYTYKFTYGYVESRFKFPATRGFFTAFWMLPANPSYSYNTEIDILELLGDDPTTMFMTYHYNDRASSYTPNTGKFNNGACAVKNYATDFVRMGVDWQPDHIAWYIDGVKCGQYTNAAQIENGPMQLILHMMIDNNWQRSWNVGLQDPSLIRALEVDYIRVYQQVP